MNMQGNYASEFPGFDLAGISIPAEWVDMSWRNNGAPSWCAVVSDHLSVDIWIDHVDPAARTCEQERFVVAAVRPDGAHLCHLIATDEWPDVLGAIAYARTLPDLSALLSDDRLSLHALAQAIDLPGCWNAGWITDKVMMYIDPAAVICEAIEEQCGDYVAEVSRLREDMRQLYIRADHWRIPRHLIEAE
jgi:hypothetical protein